MSDVALLVAAAEALVLEAGVTVVELVEVEVDSVA